MLKNLGIVLWKLRYPVIFTKNIPIQLLSNVRLLIVSDIFISYDDSFIQDVIRTIHLTSIEVYMITVDKINTLILSLKLLDYCWLIGVKISCNFCSVMFYTPSLSILKHDIHAKRDLWNQIYKCL